MIVRRRDLVGCVRAIVKIEVVGAEEAKKKQAFAEEAGRAKRPMAGEIAWKPIRDGGFMFFWVFLVLVTAHWNVQE